MSDNTLRFISFAPEAFSGINSQNAKDMVFVLPESGERIVEFEGDQGRRKTSLLNFIKFMCGGEMPDNAINSDDKDLRGSSSFMVGDTEYKVRATKSGFTVSFTSPTSKGKLDSPKSKLQEIIGSIGLDPMMLKNKSGKDQIKWLRDTFRLTDDQRKTEAEILNGYDKAYEARTGVNRDVDRLLKEVSSTGYYQFDKDNWHFTHTDLYRADKQVVEANSYDDQTIQEKYLEAQKKVNTYSASQRRRGDLNDILLQKESNVTSLKKQLEELQQRIKIAEAEVESTKETIKTADDWFANNPDPQKELDAALDLIKNSGHIQNKANAIAAAQKKHDECMQVIEKKIQLEGEVAEYLDRQKEFIKNTTPAIDGLEVIVGNWHPEKSEGIYYHGRTPQQLSESEAWEFYLKLCQALDIKVVLLENVTSMGSSAIEVINQFTASGGYVFCTKMNRQQKNINISFHHKYE